MRRALFSAAFAWQIGTALSAPPRQVQLEGSRFVGAAGCKSSSCHGGAGEKRSQYITWSRHDTHTRGYAILTNARSERMAEALNLSPVQEEMARATTSARCTICHSPFQAIAQTARPATLDPGESISCENCHGAAGVWLRGHTRPDWTYATRIGAGMRDLKSFYVRANTCVACHQNIDTDLSQAGHPALLFELDSQSLAEPKHWRDPEGTGVRAWLVGQAVALREMSWKLSQNPPDDETLNQWRGLLWLLAKVTASDSTLSAVNFPDPAATDPFRVTQQRADALARRAAEQSFSSAFAQRMLELLSATTDEFKEAPEAPREALFRRGQRLVLALEALRRANDPSAALLGTLRSDLRYLANFEPAQFAADLKELQNKR